MNVNFLYAAEKELEEGIEYYNAQRSGLGFEFCLVPTLQRGNESCTAPEVRDAERLWRHSHAERGNDA